ncbi:MAG: hypothetical protein ACD_23C00699G0001 [uncultured bacterium]|nr:MAG: hypothetical protein ACD_23C00699G0001 [uncultured bacterium]
MSRLCQPIIPSDLHEKSRRPVNSNINRNEATAPNQPNLQKSNDDQFLLTDTKSISNAPLLNW